LAAEGHAWYLDERNIDVQIIGPRPFLTLGWMEPHLVPAWSRFWLTGASAVCPR
jgi:hypothetical protein